MLLSSIPAKFTIPFANGAGADVRPIPQTPSGVPGAAAFSTGFPPLNFVQPSAGGIPPDGRDMNGILNMISAWDQWFQAGGPVQFDAAFAANAGGYPRGAVVMSNTGHVWFENLIDGNTNDPNAAASINWIIAFSPWSATAWPAAGSANAQVLTISPAPTSAAQLVGIPITFTSQGTNTTAATLNVNATGTLQIVQTNGLPLGLGALVAGALVTVVSNGTNYRMTSQTSVFTDGAAGGVTVSGPNNSNGANVALFGNGGTTPNKFIRAAAGVLQFLNSAYNSVLATLTDAGTLTVASSITAGGAITANTGNIFASAGMLRANTGAFGSGDPLAATILRDFTIQGNGAGWWFRAPDGVIIQGAQVVLPGNNVRQPFNLPIAFPSSFLGLASSYSFDAVNGVPIGSVGVTNNGLTGVFIGSNTTTPAVSNNIFYIAVGL